MKKVIVGLGAVGAVIALRGVAKNGTQKMREHCKEMAGKCKQTMAGQSGEGAAAAGMPDHCTGMAAQFRGRGAATEEREHREEVAAQV